MSVPVTRHRVDRTPPSGHPLTAAIRADATADGMPLVAAWCVLVIPIAGSLLLMGLYLVSRDSYYQVLREDHLVEWGQFALLLLCSVLAAAGAFSAAKRHRLLVGGLLGLAALAFFGLAGEEISWGQRVFALTVPETLAAVNQQSELNLHNINSGGLDLQDMFKIASAVLGLAGVVMAFAPRSGRTGRVFRTSAARLLTVPRYAVPGFALMALFWPVHLTLADVSPMSRFQEWVEFGFYLSLAATLIAVLARLRARTVGTVGADVRVVAGHRFVVIASVVIVAVTVVFAVLTSVHGIIPVNAR